jgi:hypothetical protein
MKSVSRYGITLRLVEVKDAEFILDLRTNSLLNQHLSPTSTKIIDQLNWIQNYKLREQQGSEFYFIAQDIEGNKYGTTRLYNFDEKSFEVGSWIFSPEAPSGMAIKADIICREIGFDLLNADYCRFEVRKKNKSVVRYHLGYRPKKVNEDELNLYFILSKEDFNSHKIKLLKFIQNGN